MSLKLDALDGDQRPPVKGEGTPVGVLIVSKDEQWIAKRDDGEVREGIGNFKNFGSGNWVNNMNYSDSIQLFRGSLKKNIRSESWWRISVSEMLCEWGSSEGDPIQAANLLSILFGRMSRMLIHMIRTTSEDAETAESEWRNLCGSASLATGIYCLFEKALESHIPHETEMTEHFDKSRQIGFGFRRSEKQDNDIVLDFRLPLFTHARKILSEKVPEASIWKRARREEKVPISAFMESLVKSGKPALVRALLSPDNEKSRDWVAAFMDPGAGERSRFLCEEMALLSDIPMEVDSALVGAGWTDPVMRSPLDIISDYCGGDAAASLSWSAGIVAENLLAAPHRTGRNKTYHASGDAIWMAARDRILMTPVVAAAENSGGRVVSARTGRIKVAAPPVPEVVNAIVWSVWEAGAHLDYGSAVRLARSGACSDLPMDRDTYGGNDADYIHAAACHAGDRSVIWKFDGVPEFSADRRDKVMRSLYLLP